MNKKHFINIITVLIMLLCNKLYATEIVGNNLVDKEKFSIPIKEYKRIVIIDSTAAENAYMLGAVKNVVGVANTRSPLYKDNEILKATSDIGNYHLPSLEAIIALKPDLVILAKSSYKIGVKLKSLKIPAITFDYDNLDDIFKNARLLAKLVNKEHEAEKIIKVQEKKLQKIKAQPLSNIKGALIFSANPIIAYNGDTFIGQILEVIGINNIAQKALGSQSTLSIEYILQEDPDFLILMASVRDLGNEYPLLSRVKASKNNHILSIVPNELLWGSLHVIDNIEKLHQKLLVISKYKENNK